MSQDSELQRLERFVEKLLVSFNELRAEKTRLLQQLSERDQQIDELQNNVAAQEVERDEISHRVGKLVEQIEEWENSLEDDAIALNVSNTEESIRSEESIVDEYEVQEELAEIMAEPHDEEETRVQHNLFSMKSVQR